MPLVKREGKKSELKIEVVESGNSMELDDARQALALLARWAARRAQNGEISKGLSGANSVIDDVPNSYEADKSVN